jgi:hypothetical protein
MEAAKNAALRLVRVKAHVFSTRRENRHELGKAAKIISYGNFTGFLTERFLARFDGLRKLL